MTQGRQMDSFIVFENRTPPDFQQIAPVDECYHDACDSLENINMQGLVEMADAAAYAVNVLAVNDLPTPAAKLLGRKRRVANAGIDLDYRGGQSRKYAVWQEEVGSCAIIMNV